MAVTADHDSGLDLRTFSVRQRELVASFESIGIFPRIITNITIISENVWAFFAIVLIFTLDRDTVHKPQTITQVRGFESGMLADQSSEVAEEGLIFLQHRLALEPPQAPSGLTRGQR